MKCAVKGYVASDELRRLVQLNRKQFMSKFFFEKSAIVEEAFDSLSGDLVKLLVKPQIMKLALTKENQTIGIAIVDESKWDSDILGLKYGKIKLLCFHPEANQEEKAYLLENMMTSLSNEGFRLVIARNPMDDVSTINALEREGAVVTDVLMTLQRDVKNIPLLQPSLEGVWIVQANANDEGDAVRIGRSVFKVDHYHSDQRLPNSKSDELYGKWTANSFHGFADSVLVAKKGSNMLGFITCKIENLTSQYKYGVIDLVGVANESKGKGIGTALVAEALKWFSKSVTSVYVGTQSGNINALRLYEKSGFKVTSAEATLHLWIPQETRRSPKS